MAIRLGFVLMSASSGDATPGITADFADYSGQGWPASAADIGTIRAGNVSLKQRPVTSYGTAKRGYGAWSYLDDFYYRIHIIPASLDFGNILADEHVPLRVWNAFFTNKTLTATSVPSQTGVALVPPSGVVYPFAMTPLREITFDAVATLGGPPVFSDTATITIDGVVRDVPITGRRLVLFPFPPNWNSAYDETFVYDSWVLPAEDGSEQTGSNWGNQPRRQYDYTILVRRDQAQRLENLLFGWQHRLFGLPHWADKTKLASAAVVGATVLAADTTDRSFKAGGFGVLYADADNYEPFEVESFTTGTLTISSPLARNWPLGTRVYPVSPALVNDNVSGAHHSDQVIVMPVSFECEPSLSPDNTPIGGPTPLYRGEELYLGKLNWASPITFKQESDRTVLDYKTGTFKSYSSQGFSKTTRKHNWQLRDRAEAREFRAWLGRREGIARPVYMPSGNADFLLAGNIVLGSGSIDVVDNGYYSFVAMASAKRDIIILLRDGTYLARRITDAVPLVNNTLRLTVDTVINQTVTPEQVKRISFLGFYRMASNSNTIRWLTDTIGTVESDLRMKTTV